MIDIEKRADEVMKAYPEIVEGIRKFMPSQGPLRFKHFWKSAYLEGVAKKEEFVGYSKLRLEAIARARYQIVQNPSPLDRRISELVKKLAADFNARTGTVILKNSIAVLLKDSYLEGFSGGKFEKDRIEQIAAAAIEVTLDFDSKNTDRGYKPRLEPIQRLLADLEYAIGAVSRHEERIARAAIEDYVLALEIQAEAIRSTAAADLDLQPAPTSRMTP